MRLKTPARGVFDIAQRAIEHGRRLRRPKTSRLEGLAGRVEVLTDVYGVPHIYADNTDDLFFAQGYVTARDRLFQMDYNRLAAAGRLSELVGNRVIPWEHLSIHLKERTTYDVDVMLRTFGMARAARESLEVHSDEAREILRAYAAGVNAYLVTGARSIEHRILRHAPGPWSEVDSLIMLKAMGFELNFAWRSILLGAIMMDAGIPEDVARVLSPHLPPDGSTIVDKKAWAAMARDLTLTRSAADSALGFGNAAGVGSNAMAIAGSLSATGDALLANDTHLTLSAPLPFYEVHLEGGGLDMHGFAVPGVPGIGIGRTPAFSWGITAGLVQDLDIFVEKLHPDDPTRYLTPDGWQPLYEHHERFKVRGQGEHERVIYESRHGPLLETLATEAANGHRFAIAWTGHRPGRDLDGLLQLWRAESFEQCQEGLRYLVCPPYNITLAAADGRVGYIMAGVIPRRRPGTPTRPLEGWTGQWDWDGIVPPEHNPGVIDPECGFVVTANNRVAPLDYPYELGCLFEPPHRYDRIRDRLEALGNKITLDDLADIQLDTYSAWGRAVCDALLGAVGGVEGLAPNAQTLEREVAELWRDWDGFADSDSAGAAIGLVAPLTVGREVVRRLAGEDVAFGFVELGAFIGESILALPRIADRLAELGVELGDVIRYSFRATVELCREKMGSEPSNWTWGALHPIVCRHRLDASPLGPFFAVGPEPAGGGPDTVNRGDVGPSRMDLKVGAAMRYVANARDRDAAGSIVPAGQSGDRFSQHYDDQLGDFLSGRLKPAPMTREKIAVAFREELLPDDK